MPMARKSKSGSGWVVGSVLTDVGLTLLDNLVPGPEEAALPRFHSLWGLSDAGGALAFSFPQESALLFATANVGRLS